MKWWFSDFDGTLCKNHKNEIDDQDLNFINKWIAAGNKFIIASGRTVSELDEIFNNHNVSCDYFICNNGALVYDKKQQLISQTNIPMTARQEIIELFRQFKDKLSLGYCLGETRVAYSFVESKDKTLNEFLDSKDLSVVINTNTDNEILNSSDLNTAYIFSDAKTITAVKPFFENVSGCKLVQTHGNVLEIMNEKVSKAHGIEIIQALHNFEDADIVASGDGENDIEMLQKANHAFVMESHQPNVDHSADHIISGVHEIEKYL